MHIPPGAWIAACLSIRTATAFYPYEWKNGDDSTGKVRRTVRGSPLPSTQNRRSVTLPLRRVHRPRDNIYNIVNSNDPGKKNSVAIDQDGTDLSYMVAVTVGDSKEEYHLLLDSAASNTWIMGQDCKTDACGTHALFGEGDSSTLKTETTPFSITYGTGSVSGTVASDVFHIGSLAPSVSFGLATNVSDEFKAYPMDGILGIGRGDTVEGTIEAPQVMDVLTSEDLIGAKLYGIHLSRAKDGLKDGELNFGEPNPDRFTGNLNFVPTVSNDAGFWEIGIDDAGVNDVEIGLGGRTAIIDTGTSFIFMPEADATSIHDNIDGFQKSGETYSVPCNTQKVIWIKFGGVKYEISTADWIGGQTSDGNCRSNIIGRQTFGEKQWLVGDVFLKNVYSVFDFDNNQVGFGVKSGEKGEETPTSASPSGTPTAASASPAGPSTTGSEELPASTTAEAQDSTGTPSPTGAAGHLSAPMFSLIFSFALGFLAMFS